MTSKNTWTTASGCANDSCVEVDLTGRSVKVRDGKLGDDSPVLEFTPDEWAAFQSGARSGEFDLS